jgi:hypothetical protein
MKTIKQEDTVRSGMRAQFLGDKMYLKFSFKHYIMNDSDFFSFAPQKLK